MYINYINCTRWRPAHSKLPGNWRQFEDFEKNSTRPATYGDGILDRMV